MEQITMVDLTSELVKQLESTLSRIALAAQSNISTYNLEDKAKKLATKIKGIAVYSGLPIYKDVSESDSVWHPEDKLTDATFAKYAFLCKNSGESLSVYKDSNTYYCKISDKLFINIEDISAKEIPSFKVKIEDNTLMAVRSDLLASLPSSVQKLLNGGTNE